MARRNTPRNRAVPGFRSPVTGTRVIFGDMSLLLTNALLCDIDPIGVEHGAIRIEGKKIVARGKLERAAGDEVIDCNGAVVLPGLVNGHTHLYSALAVGMPAPPKTPENFYEILKYVWWRLDRALDAESNE